MADSMAQGAKEFGRGIFQGVTGVVMEVTKFLAIRYCCCSLCPVDGGGAAKNEAPRRNRPGRNCSIKYLGLVTGAPDDIIGHHLSFDTQLTGLRR